MWEYCKQIQVNGDYLLELPYKSQQSHVILLIAIRCGFLCQKQTQFKPPKTVRQKRYITELKMWLLIKPLNNFWQEYSRITACFMGFTIE